MIFFQISVILIIVVLLATAFYLFFNRNPRVNVPGGNAITSPADGKIIKVLPLKDLKKLKLRKGVFGKINTLVPESCKDGFLVTIMMNVLDVHVQKSPVSGKIINTQHRQGRFKNAVFGSKFENGLENEKNEILIRSEKGDIKVIQIAGVLARRIICFVKKGQNVKKGDDLGKINLGSQVALILPKNTKVVVSEGKRVKVGKSIIARWH